MGGSLCSADLPQNTQDVPLPPLSVSNRGAQLVCEIAERKDVAAGMGRDIDIIDGFTGKRKHQLKGHVGPVTCLITCEGALFSGSVDRTIMRWDTRRSSPTHTMMGHTGPVWCLAVSNKCLYSTGDDTTIRRWDTATGDLLGVLEDHNQPVVCLLAVGHSLFSGSGDRTLLEWDLKSMRLRRTICHSSSVMCMVSADGSIFTGCSDATIRRWSRETGELEATLAGGCRGSPRCQRYSPDDTGVDEAGEDVSILCLYATPSYVFSGCRDGSIAKWNLAGNQLVARLGGVDEHELGVTCFLQHSDMILSGSADGTVRLWETESGELCNILEGGSGVTCLVAIASGVIFGGQARGTPQRLPPLMRRRWWKKEERGARAPAATEAVGQKPPPEAARKFL